MLNLNLKIFPMVKVKNWLNAHEFPVKGEVNLEPSLTIPDESLSIREIIDRFSRGLGLNGVRVPVYDPENDLPDPKYLDLADRQALAEEYRAELEAIEADRVSKAEKVRKALESPENVVRTVSDEEYVAFQNWKQSKNTNIP